MLSFKYNPKNGTKSTYVEHFTQSKNNTVLCVQIKPCYVYKYNCTMCTNKTVLCVQIILYSWTTMYITCNLVNMYIHRLCTECTVFSVYGLLREHRPVLWQYIHGVLPTVLVVLCYTVHVCVVSFTLLILLVLWIPSNLVKHTANQARTPGDI